MGEIERTRPIYPLTEGEPIDILNDARVDYYGDILGPGYFQVGEGGFPSNLLGRIIAPTQESLTPPTLSRYYDRFHLTITERSTLPDYNTVLHTSVIDMEVADGAF